MLLKKEDKQKDLIGNFVHRSNI